MKLSPGPFDEPLDEIRHPLLNKVREQFADRATPHERILAVKDTIMFKAKIERWRGAVWTDPAIEASIGAWLVAAGMRTDGSPDDFYQVMADEAKTGRALQLLPNQDDRDRYDAESAVRLTRLLQTMITNLCRAALLDGHEHADKVGGAVVGIQIRAEDGHETYVAIRVIGPVPDEVTAVILRRVPGCEPDSWFLETAMPERALAPAEQVWSNLMSPEAAARLLDDEDESAMAK